MRLFLDYRPALKDRTGVGEWVHQLARTILGLKRAGDPLANGVEVILFSSSRRDRPDPAALADLPGASLVDRHVPVRLLNAAWYKLGWPPVEQVCAQRFDVVQSTNPVLLPARGGLRAVTIYDLDFYHHPERAWGEMRADFPSLVQSHARRADLIVTISEYSAGEIRQHLAVEPEQILVCRPGVPEWIAETRTAPLEPGDGGYILFVGTLEPRKNVPGLLNAYERLLARHPGAPRLVLAGRPTPAADAWIARAASPAFKGRIDIRGYVGVAERAGLYQGARMLVLPSFDEGFGLPALEAMALGIPVVVSTRGALPEVIGGAGLLIEPDEAEGLCEAMRRIWQDPGVAGTLRDAGLIQAARFSWQDSARALLAGYRDGLARRSRAESS